MKPGILRWIRVLANLLGAFGISIAFVNPPAIFNKEQPAAFVFLCASAVLWAIAIRAPFSGFIRIMDLGGMGAILVLVAFESTKISAVHDWLLIRQHEDKGPALHWAQDSDDLDPRYGPRLVRSDAAMARRYSLLKDYPAAHNISREAFDYFFLYASLRLRGKSDEQIFADPIGPSLFLGTLMEETHGPEWWEKADWFKSDLKLHPTADWKVGLLPPAWAQTKFQALAANPPTDPSIVEALLVAYEARPDLGTSQQLESLFEKWGRIREESGHSLRASLEARQGIAKALQSGLQEGKVGVRFAYPDSWTQKARDVYSLQLLRFLRASGVNPEVRADGIPVMVSASFREWDNVEYTLQEQVWKEIAEEHPGGPIAGTYASRTPYTTHRDVAVNVHTGGRGRIGVPTLIVGIGEHSFALPPVTIINRNSAEHLAECDPSRDNYKDTYEKFLAGMTLAPWEFALSYPNPWPKTAPEAAARLAEWKAQ